jgi:peptide/nickel transport system ATP-binding protein
MLEIEDLHVRFATPQGEVHAVRGVSFAVERERVGIVGESGSGKTMTGRAILRLTPRTASVAARRLAFAAKTCWARALRGCAPFGAGASR